MDDVALLLYKDVFLNCFYNILLQIKMVWTLNQIMQTYEGGPFTRESARNTIRASTDEQARDALENMLYTNFDIDMTNGDVMKLELIRLVNNTAVVPGNEGRKKRKGSKSRSRRKGKGKRRSRKRLSSKNKRVF